MLHLVALCLALTARAVPVSPDLYDHRLFRLELGGQRSHLLVVPDVALDDDRVEMATADALMQNSCEVYLRGATSFDRPAEDQSTVTLVDHLPPARRRTLKSLGLADLYDRREPTTVDRAWRQTRAALKDLRERKFDAYTDRVQATDAIELDFEIDPDLHLAAEQLLGGPLEDIDLLHRAGEWGAKSVEDDAPARVDIEKLARGRAIRGEAMVLYLDRHSPPPPRSVNLDAYLGRVHSVLKERPLDLYVNRIVGAYLEAELAARYFTMPPQKYAIIRSLLAYTGYFDYSNWAGEEALAEHEGNVHEHWVDPLVTAMKTKSIFVMVNARFVLPDLEPARRHSLLDLLNDRGVSIVPLTPRRGGLHSVK